MIRVIKTFSILILYFLTSNTFVHPNSTCDAKKDTRFQGVYVDGRKANAELQERVKRTICEIIQDINDCKFLLRHEKTKIKSMMQKIYFNIVFARMGGCGAGYAYPLNPIKIQIKEEFINNDTSPGCCTFKSTLAHELIHLWYPLNGTNPQECITYKIEKKCFCESLDWDSINKRFKCDKSPIFKEWMKEHDVADDNYSFSDGNALRNFASPLNVPDNIIYNDEEFSSYNNTPDVILYNKYYLDKKELLIKKILGDNYLTDSTPDCFSNTQKLLIISAGELMGDENSIIIKSALDRFVESGGTLLVFGQQYGAHFEKLVPVPDGETLKAFGWREDQSCINGSAYFSSSHPVLSSSPGGLVQIAVDGHFPEVPSGATVILKKRTNNEPVLLHYKYGQGSVILTSLYSDWGYAHSQASEFELKIVRDLITFAKKPDLPIPTHDMDDIPNPFIGLNVDVRNDSEYPAAKVRLVAYTPDRNIKLHEAEQNISLNPGEEITIPLNFTLPGDDLEPGIIAPKAEQCSTVRFCIFSTGIDKTRQARYKYYESKTLG